MDILKNELNDLLDQVTDEVYSNHRDSTSEETFQSCNLCGEWEGHTDVCPIPAIETWQKYDALTQVNKS